MGNEAPEQTSPLAGGKPGTRVRWFWLKAAVGSTLFTGYSPFAPATVSSLLVLLPAWLLRPWPIWHALAIAVVFFIGVPLATELEKLWGPDPGRVTIDEVVGTLVTFFALPPFTLLTLVLGLFIWRFFDIVKLPFIDRSQRLPGGWGIMMDDLLAGVCANLTLQVLLRLIPRVWPAMDTLLRAR